MNLVSCEQWTQHYNNLPPPPVGWTAEVSVVYDSAFGDSAISLNLDYGPSQSYLRLETSHSEDYSLAAQIQPRLTVGNLGQALDTVVVTVTSGSPSIPSFQVHSLGVVPLMGTAQLVTDLPITLPDGIEYLGTKVPLTIYLPGDTVHDTVTFSLPKVTAVDRQLLLPCVYGGRNGLEVMSSADSLLAFVGGQQAWWRRFTGSQITDLAVDNLAHAVSAGQEVVCITQQGTTRSIYAMAGNNGITLNHWPSSHDTLNLPSILAPVFQDGENWVCWLDGSSFHIVDADHLPAFSTPTRETVRQLPFVPEAYCWGQNWVAGRYFAFTCGWADGIGGAFIITDSLGNRLVPPPDQPIPLDDQWGNGQVVAADLNGDGWVEFIYLFRNPQGQGGYKVYAYSLEQDSAAIGTYLFNTENWYGPTLAPTISRESFADSALRVLVAARSRWGMDLMMLRLGNNRCERQQDTSAYYLTSADVIGLGHHATLFANSNKIHGLNAEGLPLWPQASSVIVQLAKGERVIGPPLGVFDSQTQRWKLCTPVQISSTQWRMDRRWLLEWSLGVDWSGRHGDAGNRNYYRSVGTAPDCLSPEGTTLVIAPLGSDSVQLNWQFCGPPNFKQAGYRVFRSNQASPDYGDFIGEVTTTQRVGQFTVATDQTRSFFVVVAHSNEAYDASGLWGDHIIW